MISRLPPLRQLWPPALLGVVLVALAALTLGSPGAVFRGDIWAGRGTGYMELAPKEQKSLPFAPLPKPLAALVVTIDCNKGNCGDLLLSHHGKVVLPFRSAPGRAAFMLRFPAPGKTPALTVANNGPAPVELGQASARNYVAGRRGLPGFWVLLKGSRLDRLSRAWLLFLLALALAMQGAALSPNLMRRDPARLAKSAKRLVIAPGLLLAAHGVLALFGQSLVISAETFLAAAGLGPLLALAANRRFWRLLAGWVESGRAHILPLAWVALASYTLWVVWTHFAAGQYSYEGLTIYNDWLSNAVYMGRPFWQTQGGVSGLSYSFSPSLILLTPFYWLFDSQFVLPVLGSLSVYLSVVPVLRVHSLLRAPLAPRPAWQDLLLALCLFVILAGNMYVRSAAVFVGPTYFFMLPACLAFFWLLKNASWPALLALTFVAMGVRQDAGLYLAWLFVLVLFVPARTVARPKVVFVKAAVLFAVSLGGSLWLLHHLGFPPGARSVSNGLYDLATNFPAWGRAVADSAWFSINNAHAWMSIFNPAGFLLSNLAGLVQFTSPNEAARHLAGQGAGLVLPLFSVAAVFGLAHLARFLDTARGYLPHWRTPLLLAPLLLAGTGMLFTLGNFSELTDPQRRFVPAADRSPLDWAEVAPRTLAACPSLSSVASDRKTIVFAPNRFQRYLLEDFYKAEAVFLAQGVDTPFFKQRSFEEMDFWIRGTGAFRLVRFTPHFKFYVRASLPCAKAAGP